MSWTNLTKLFGFNDRVANVDSNSADDFNTVKKSIDELAGNSSTPPDKTVQENADDISTLQTNPSLPYGYIQGLGISNGTDTDHEIDIATGRCKDSTGVQDIISSSIITIDIEDSGVNGLDTGSVAADTFYYIYLIYNPTTTTYAGLFSLNASSPTLPAGYTYFRRVRGAVLTDGSSNIIQFSQKDNCFMYHDYIEDLLVSGSGAGTTRQLLTASCPPSFVGIFQLFITEGDISFFWFDSINRTDAAATVNNCDIRVPNNSTVNKQIITDSSSQIAYRSNRDAMSTVRIDTYGFIDNAEL